MPATNPNEMIPRGFLLAAGALICVSLILALVARVTDIGAVRTVAPAVIDSIDLRLEDRGNGRLAVIDARTDSVLKVIPPGRDGFIRVAISGLEFDRKARGVESSQSFRLGRAKDGSYWLHDLATGRYLQLAAFGHANIMSFAQFLPAERNVE